MGPTLWWFTCITIGFIRTGLGGFQGQGLGQSQGDPVCVCVCVCVCGLGRESGWK